jgi:hypothetical protein
VSRGRSDLNRSTHHGWTVVVLCRRGDPAGGAGGSGSPAAPKRATGGRVLNPHGGAAGATRVENVSSFRGQAIATILPGRAYGHDRPLLRSAREGLEDRGWTVRPVEWDIAQETTPEQAQRAVRLLEQAPLEGARAGIHLVVAKSLGTLLLPAAVRLELPGVWLTPLLYRFERGGGGPDCAGAVLADRRHS